MASQESKFVSLQVGITATGKSYRILLPIAYQDELAQQLGREFVQGEPWEITPLSDEPGYKLVPLKK